MRDGKENTEESFSWGNEFRARKITDSENSGDEEAGEREWRWGWVVFRNRSKGTCTSKALWPLCKIFKVAASTQNE